MDDFILQITVDTSENVDFDLTSSKLIKLKALHI